MIVNKAAQPEAHGAARAERQVYGERAMKHQSMLYAVPIHAPSSKPIPRLPLRSARPNASMRPVSVQFRRP